MEFKVKAFAFGCLLYLRINRNIMKFKDLIIRLRVAEKARINRNIMEFKDV